MTDQAAEERERVVRRVIAKAEVTPEEGDVLRAYQNGDLSADQAADALALLQSDD